MMGRSFLLAPAGVLAVFVLAACAGGGMTELSETPAAAGSPSAGTPPASPLATSSLAPSPAATPRSPQEGPIQVLDYRSYPALDRLYFIGQVINSGSEPATSIEIELTLTDENGEVVGTGRDALQALSLLSPGETMPFKIRLNGLPSSWALEQFRVRSVPAPAGQAPDYTQFEVTNLQVLGLDGHELLLQGELTNTGEMVATNVLVTFVGWDAQGTLLVAWQVGGPPSLAPGMSTQFTIQILDAQGTPATYTFIVTGKTS